MDLLNGNIWKRMLRIRDIWLGSADLYLWITDLDSDPDPAIFDSGLQGDN